MRIHNPNNNDTRYRHCTYPAHDFAGAPALVEAFRRSLREVHNVALHEETLVAQAWHPVHQVPHPVPLLLQENRVTAGSTTEMENVSRGPTTLVTILTEGADEGQGWH